MLSGRKSLVSKPRDRSLSQFRAFTCFVLTDRVVGLVEIEFLLVSFQHPISALASSPLHFFSIDVSPSGTYWATTLQLGLPLCNHLDLAASFLLGRCVVPVFPTGFPVFPTGLLGSGSLLLLVVSFSDFLQWFEFTARQWFLQ